MHPKIHYILKEWVEPIALAIILALFIRTFFVQAFKIPTSSMRPTLMEGDRILVEKVSYRFHEPKRGDIVVFKFPRDRKKDFIKRLVGFGGETIEIKGGKILIDGKVLADHPVIAGNYYYNRDDWPYGREGEAVRIPEGCYFVLGDNSAQSSDSRNWGFVEKRNMIGRAVFIYWPLNRIRVLK